MIWFWLSNQIIIGRLIRLINLLDDSMDSEDSLGEDEKVVSPDSLKEVVTPPSTPTQQTFQIPKAAEKLKLRSKSIFFPQMEEILERQKRAEASTRFEEFGK